MMVQELKKEKQEKQVRRSGKFTLPKFNPFFGKEKVQEEDAEPGEQEPKEKPAGRKRQREEKPDQLQEEVVPMPAPDRITITMLGVSGSGKTMFLSGVYQSLIQSSCQGISLAGDDARMLQDSSLKVTGQIAEIALINRGGPEEGWSFPVGTNRTVEYPLRLLCRGNEVCEFDFLDYAGGQLDNLLKVPETDLNTDQKKLKDQLKKSDALMIFVDADVIARHDVMGNSAELALCRMETGVHTVGQVFNDLYPFYRGRPMTVLFVLTKIDKLPERLRQGDYDELVMRVQEVYKDLWQTLKSHRGAAENQWNIGMVPVTAVGRKNEVRHIKMTEERDGSRFVIEKDVAMQIPQPENMDAAMVYAAAAILKQKCLELTQRQKDLVPLMYGPDKVQAREAKRQSAALEELRKRLDGYVISMTQGAGTVSRILMRSDILGWWTR